jgi:hypothetical protein
MWSYTGFLRRAHFSIIALCLAGGIGGYLWIHGESIYHEVVMTLESSVPVETQLFYDTGRGFNEKESDRKVIYQAGVPVTLYFELAGVNIRALRFDPSRSQATIRIHEIILKYHGAEPFKVPLDSLSPVKDIRSLRYDGKVLTVETAEGGEDPILGLTRIGPAPRLTPFKIMTAVLAGVFVALGVAFIVVWVYRYSLNSEEIRTSLRRFP